MKLLLLGADGQLGHQLRRALSPLGTVLALDRRGADLSELATLRTTVRSATADVIVNAAAYTRVDDAEGDKDLAFRVNAEAPAVLAEEAARSGAMLIHYSTDYVFDGRARKPYLETDATAPLNVYGASKLAGDQAILSSDATALIFRISWVFSNTGHNFLRTIQRLARTRDELTIVDDQFGSPTWVGSIADATVSVVNRWQREEGRDALRGLRGLYHATSPDHTTWYEFAKAIIQAMDFESAKPRPQVRPISSREYPARAPRPLWTVLDSSKLRRTFDIQLPPWRQQLQACVDDGRAAGSL